LVWDGAGTLTSAATTTKVSVVSGYPKAEYPAYGIVPEFEDDPWMTVDQAKDYGRLKSPRLEYTRPPIPSRPVCRLRGPTLMAAAELQTPRLIGGDRQLRMQITLAYPY